MTMTEKPDGYALVTRGVTPDKGYASMAYAIALYLFSTVPDLERVTVLNWDMLYVVYTPMFVVPEDVQQAVRDNTSPAYKYEFRATMVPREWVP